MSGDLRDRHGGRSGRTAMTEPPTLDAGRRPRPVLLRAARARAGTGARPATHCPHAAISASQLRFDRQTGQWVIIAALRQDRTYKPPPDQCPLCPGPSGDRSEIPAPDYDVVAFENRFPACPARTPRRRTRCPTWRAAVRRRPGTRPLRGDLLLQRPHRDRSPGSQAHARLVVDAWRHRSADMWSRTGIEQVFCFENRGEEIGVTLTHPHGQIYGYPFLTPRTEHMLRQADAHRASRGTNLFADILAAEVADGSRGRSFAPSCSPPSYRSRHAGRSRCTSTRTGWPPT